MCHIATAKLDKNHEISKRAVSHNLKKIKGELFLKRSPFTYRF
jgi:hypothetical protein